MDEIYSIFSLLFGITKNDLKKGIRKRDSREITDYRFLMCYFLYTKFHSRPTDIKIELGFKSHQSVYYAIDYIAGLKESNRSIRNKVEILEFML